MRNIEFRGKCVNSKTWIFGFYSFDLEFHAPMIMQLENYSGFPHEPESQNQKMYQVDPKTIGQYINKNYEDGTQMFEGDIVECYAEETNAVAGAFADIFRVEELIGVIAFKDGEIGVMSEGVFLTNALNCAPKVEKLGDIHDTPELLTNA